MALRDLPHEAELISVFVGRARRLEGEAPPLYILGPGFHDGRVARGVCDIHLDAQRRRSRAALRLEADRDRRYILGGRQHWGDQGPIGWLVRSVVGRSVGERGGPRI